MKRKYLICVLILSFNFITITHSQKKSKKDKAYYLQVLDTVQDKRTKAEALRFLIPKADNDLQFADYSDEYVDIMIELEEYEAAADVAIFAFYYVNANLNDNDRAMRLIGKIERHIDNFDNSYIVGNIYLKKGGGYFSVRDYTNARNNYDLAIQNFGSKDSIYVADAYFFRGQTNFQTNNFLGAIQDYTMASKYYENIGDKEYYFFTLGDIINVYGAIGFYEKSALERNKLIDKKLKLNFKNGLHRDYYNQALTYGKLGQIKEEGAALHQALKACLQEEKQKNRSTIYYAAIAKYYADIDLKKSQKYLDSSETSFGSAELDIYDLSLFNRSKAYVLFKEGMHTKAMKLFFKELEAAESSNNTLLTRDLYETIAKIYDLKQQKNEALDYYKKFTQLNDSLLNVTKINGLSYYQTLYETEQQEKEIITQQKDIQLLENQNRVKLYLIIFGSIGLLLSFVSIVFYRKRIQIQKEKQIQDAYSQKLLVSQELDRKRVSKDLHDGLGHSLLIIKNKLSEKNDNEVNQLVGNAIEEMRTISRGLHPHQLEDFGLSRALENLILQLDENYENTYIFGEIENIDHKVDPTQSLNIFRIVQECLSNVVKHADAVSAKVSLRMNMNKIYLDIKDNGKGFDFSKKYAGFKTLGLKTIEERVKFLKGTMYVQSNHNKGTLYSIEIPNE